MVARLYVASLVLVDRSVPDLLSPSQDGADFTHCVSPANGRASCVAVDGDFLGMSYDHKEAVKCGVVCDQVRGTFLPRLALRYSFPSAFHS